MTVQIQHVPLIFKLIYQGICTIGVQINILELDFRISSINMKFSLFLHA